MAWRVTADVLRFDEAIDWFRARLPITDDELDRLSASSRSQAWTIAGVSQLSIVQQVFDSIAKAIEKGTSFDDWKKVAVAPLTAAWGTPNSPRAETTFRNGVQSALNRGRYKQMKDPEVVELRPFWQLDAILDSRTSPICNDLDGTILPQDSNFWDTHTPPLHHRCRTGLRSLRKADAERRGVRATPPKTLAAPGFGAAPTAGEWKPRPADYTPQLWQAHKKATTRTPAAALKVGTHFKLLEQGPLTNAELSDVLLAARKARLVDFLARKPLSELGFRSDIGHGTNGAYWPALQRLRIRPDRRADTFGQPYKPGAMWSISKTATDRRDALRRTFVHELGHHVHFTAGSDADRAVRAAYADPKSKPLTQYGGTSHEEYFAESFAAWVFHRNDLRRHDPVGYRMVREVLTSQGVTP